MTRRPPAPLVPVPLDILRGLLVRKRGEERHLQTCRIGMWVDGYSVPDGAPCSERCYAVRLAVRDVVPAQAELWEAV